MRVFLSIFIRWVLHFSLKGVWEFWNPRGEGRLLVSRYAFGTRHRQGNAPLQIWKALQPWNSPKFAQPFPQPVGHCQRLSPALAKWAGKHSSVFLMMLRSQSLLPAKHLDLQAVPGCQALECLQKDNPSPLFSCLTPDVFRVVGERQMNDSGSSSLPCAGRCSAWAVLPAPWES